jgi:two-component system chemotaxis response regulator CheY
MTRTSLVVDDSKVVRKVARKMLEGFGFTVEEAEDGAQALDQCAKQLPEFILLDWNMPVMDGLSFLKELRKNHGTEKPVVIFCTTQNDFSFIEQAMQAGAQEYIMKPFDEDILQSKLMQVGLL